LAQGDRNGARERFEAALRIREGLFEADPGSTSAARDLMATHVRLYRATGEAFHATRAIQVVQRLQARGALTPDDAAMVADLRRRLGGAQ
jgi:hypothetical protein